MDTTGAIRSPPNISKEETQKLLSSRICDLSLRIRDTWLETLVDELYHELSKKGISFRPQTYLSDEWGCPQGVPVIGIPFYLADTRLYQLEEQMTDIEPETETETLMYLRHEAGHAFNYAYRLYDQVEWRQIFGNFSQPYREVYRTSPFSLAFVRHLPGWYAQKHPDDDFAETFAVWMTPYADWQVKYAGTPALAKLSYVDRLTGQFGKMPPIVSDKSLDKPVEELEMTLDAWYHSWPSGYQPRIDLSEIINEDLGQLFPDKEGQSTAEVLQTVKKKLVREVNYWTGLDRHISTSLLDELIRRVRLLELKIDTTQKNSRILNMSIFVTTLAMNFQLKSQFMPE